MWYPNCAKGLGRMLAWRLGLGRGIGANFFRVR